MIVPLCSPLLKTLVSALKSRRYLNNWQSYKHFQFIPFVMAAILNFLLILISRISADCSILFPTSKNIGVAVGIALLSHFFGQVTRTSIFFQFSSRHLGFSTDVDVRHLPRLHICVGISLSNGILHIWLADAVAK